MEKKLRKNFGMFSRSSKELVVLPKGFSPFMLCMLLGGLRKSKNLC